MDDDVLKEKLEAAATLLRCGSTQAALKIIEDLMGGEVLHGCPDGEEPGVLEQDEDTIRRQTPAEAARMRLRVQKLRRYLRHHDPRRAFDPVSMRDRFEPTAAEVKAEVARQSKDPNSRVAWLRALRRAERELEGKEYAREDDRRYAVDRLAEQYLLDAAAEPEEVTGG